MLLRFNSYAVAEDWDDLVHAFTESLKDSSLDEMILLLHTTISGPHEKRSEYIRPVSYIRLGDIPKLVMSSGDHKEIDDPRVNAAKVIQDCYRRHLEWKRSGAARKIQAAYRRRLNRKNAVRKRIDATQAHWDLLRKKSMEMEWPKDSRYYLLFRVPLGYVLVCLDTIGTFAESRKKEANKRMKTARNKDLEELDKARKQYMCDSVDCSVYQGSNKHYSSTLFRKTVDLQKKLSPTSKFHEGQSVSDLQRAILEAKAVVESLDNIPESMATRSKIQKRWDRGWRWIFEKQGSRAKGKKVEKPKLVLDQDLLHSHSVPGSFLSTQ